MIENFFNRIMFSIIYGLGKIVDTIVKLMRMLLGLDPLQGQSKTSNLVLETFGMGDVVNAFLAVMMLAFVCVFIFAIVRLVRNLISEEKDDGAVSKGKTVKGILISALYMVVLPFFCICLIMAITAVAQSIDAATGGGSQVSYCTEILFSIMDEEMLEGEAKYYYTNGIYILQEGLNGHEQFIQLKEMDAVKAYWNGIGYSSPSLGATIESPLNDQSAWKALKKIVDEDMYMDNFILPLLGACVMMFSLGMSTIIVGQRLFYCVFLFIISPLVASTRPLDDGARFRKWNEIFISKLMGSFAIIIALNVFFLISSELTTMNFFDGDSSFKNGVAKLIIYISGVIAATGASQLVAQLIGSDAGQQERDQAMNNFRSMMGGMQLTRGTTRLAGKALGAGGNFFAGKKETPLSSMLNSRGNGATASALGGMNSGVLSQATAQPLANSGTSMADKISNVMMGKTSAKDTAKSIGNKAKNSRVAKIGKGAGKLAMATAMLPVTIGRKAKNAVRNRKEVKNPMLKVQRLAKESDKNRTNGKNFINNKDLRK